MWCIPSVCLPERGSALSFALFSLQMCSFRTHLHTHRAGPWALLGTAPRPPQLCLDEKRFLGFLSGLTFAGAGQEWTERRFLPRNGLSRLLGALGGELGRCLGPLSANRKLIWAGAGLLSVLSPSCLLY